MARVSFVEFVCIVAIGVAMVELPGHRFLRPAGTETTLARAPVPAVVAADAAHPGAVVRTPPGSSR